MYKFAFIYLVKEDPKTWSDFLISLKLLYKKILRYERNIFYPDSVNLKKTYYGDCNKSDSFLLL